MGSERALAAANTEGDVGVPGRGVLYICSFHYDHISMLLGPVKRA